MIKANTFDEVHDCQESFRLMLRALSNPGEIVSLKEPAEKLEEENAVFITVALTLLDKETTFCVVDNATISEKITQVTYAKNVDKKIANFLFVTKICQDGQMEEIMSGIHPGTLAEPHTNCVLVIGIEHFPETDTCSLKGPGVQGSRRVCLPDEAMQWVKQRDKMEFEYPTGIDMYFAASNGELLAIPRKVKMEG